MENNLVTRRKQGIENTSSKIRISYFTFITTYSGPGLGTLTILTTSFFLLCLSFFFSCRFDFDFPFSLKFTIDQSAMMSTFERTNETIAHFSRAIANRELRIFTAAS